MVDWGHGARYGRVLEVLSPNVGQASIQGCAGKHATFTPDQQFVKVHYRKTRMYHDVIALVPSGLGVQKNDAVELWPGDCESGTAPRISRVLPPLSKVS
jgi:hypothetical protein